MRLERIGRPVLLGWVRPRGGRGGTEKRGELARSSGWLWQTKSNKENCRQSLVEPGEQARIADALFDSKAERAPAGSPLLRCFISVQIEMEKILVMMNENHTHFLVFCKRNNFKVNNKK